MEGFESGEFLFGRWLLSEDDVDPFDVPLRDASYDFEPPDPAFGPLLALPPLEDDLVFGLDPTGLEVRLFSDMLFLKSLF